jgi:hypothetical protein
VHKNLYNTLKTDPKEHSFQTKKPKVARKSGCAIGKNAYRASTSRLPLAARSSRSVSFVTPKEASLDAHHGLYSNPNPNPNPNKTQHDDHSRRGTGRHDS